MSKQDEKVDLEKEKKDSLKPKPRKKLPLFLNLSVRVCSFLVLFLALLSVFFIIGNNQSFLDENLVLILNFLAVTSISLFVFSTAGFVASIYYIVTQKNLLYLVAVFVFLVLIVFANVMAGVSLSVNVLSEGVVALRAS